MKLKGYKIFSFRRSHIKDLIIESSDLHTNETTITESFLTRAIECYKQEQLRDQGLITEIIKATYRIIKDYNTVHQNYQNIAYIPKNPPILTK